MNRVSKFASNPLLPLVLLLLVFLPFLASAQTTDIRFSSVTNAPLAIALIAAEPQIVTPIGVSVDHLNRVFVVESHTHSPPKDYREPKADRILVFDDTDSDGKPDRRRIFFGGFECSMNLAFDTNGSLYLTHRNGVVAFTRQQSRTSAICSLSCSREIE